MRFNQLRIENGKFRMNRHIVVLSGRKNLGVLMEVGGYCE